MAFTTAEEIRVAAAEASIVTLEAQLTAVEAALLKLDHNVRERYNAVKVAELEA